DGTGDDLTEIRTDLKEFTGEEAKPELSLQPSRSCQADSGGKRSNISTRSSLLQVRQERREHQNWSFQRKAAICLLPLRNPGITSDHRIRGSRTPCMYQSLRSGLRAFAEPELQGRYSARTIIHDQVEERFRLRFPAARPEAHRLFPSWLEKLTPAH